MLAEVAGELGIDPAHPDKDQLEAAVAETASRARKLAERTGGAALRARKHGLRVGARGWVGCGGLGAGAGRGARAKPEVWGAPPTRRAALPERARHMPVARRWEGRPARPATQHRPKATAGHVRRTAASATPS